MPFLIKKKLNGKIAVAGQGFGLLFNQNVRKAITE